MGERIAYREQRKKDLEGAEGCNLQLWFWRIENGEGQSVDNSICRTWEWVEVNGRSETLHSSKCLISNLKICVSMIGSQACIHIYVHECAHIFICIYIHLCDILFIYVFKLYSLYIFILY